MLALLFDHNLNRSIVRALGSRVPELDGITLDAVGLSEASDPHVLAWAAEHRRIVVTHDARTMIHHAQARILRSDEMPGLFVVHQSTPVRAAVDELELLLRCSRDGEWRHQIVFVAR